jgi:feruloyl esterase
MLRRAILAFPVPTLAVLLLSAIPAAAQPSCESVTRLSLPNVAIRSASPIAAGQFMLPNAAPGAPPRNVPAFCRVVGVVLPELNFELWLPVQWNRKYEAVGNGGLAGVISYTAMVDPVNRGYAVGSTDTGHLAGGEDGAWALGHLQRVVNYGQRAIHEMAQADKAIIRAYYGAPPTHSYFNGCSYGGKQAFTEVQRYPGDFDGVIAGDPANNFTRHYVGGHLWSALAMDGDGYIPAAKVPILADAVNKACDALDGIQDGVLNDPRRCHFDPSTLLCRNGDTHCLTAAQVDAVRKLWAGWRDAEGQQLYPGLVPGGEAGPGGWAQWITGNAPGKGGHSGLGVPFFKYMVFENADWDFHSFRFTNAPDFDNDVEFTDDKMGAIFNAVDPDLRAFKANGGKLIHYHGWSDPDITPLNSINYYESVVRAMGRGSAHALRDTKEFYRLFMVPGMQHCTNGPGPSRFDALTALEQWVEQSKAPEEIVAAHVTGGAIDRTRPLCAYPQEARYKGTGSTDDAANFVCALPATP